MIKFDCAERIGFHDSILTKIINFNNGIHLYLEDVYIDEVPYSIDLLRKPYRDARPARVGGFPDHGRT